MGQQVYVETRLGLRITDFPAITTDNELTGFEVKTSMFSRYNTLQQQKDSEISYFGGIIKSRVGLGGGLEYGDIARYKTLWAYVLQKPIVW